MWYFKTRAGVFYIVEKGDRFHVFFDDETLGNYTTPAQAVDDICGGHTDFPSSGIDPAELQLPCDLSEWEFSRS